MNKLERMTAVLLLLQERPRTAQEIADHFEVSRRTVLRDVQALCEMGVPVIAREGPGGGYSLPEDYHTEPLPLTAREIFLLLLAIRSIEGLSDLPFREELASLLAKLRSGLPDVARASADDLLEVVGMDGVSEAVAAPFLEALLAAAREGAWVSITYQSAERTSRQHVLPQRVYAQNGLWYCLAYAFERGETRTYRVDRMLQVASPEPGFAPGPLHSGRPYDHPEHPFVQARLSPRGRARIESDRELGQHLQRQPDGSGLLAFHCPPEELAWYARVIAGLGEDIEVDSPPELRSLLHGLGETLMKKYAER